MYSNLFYFLGQDFDNEKHLCLLNIYEDLIPELETFYKKEDLMIVSSIDLAIHKMNNVKQLTKDEQNMLDSLNYQLLKTINKKKIPVQKDYFKNSEKKALKYYEDCLIDNHMPLTSTELKRVIDYNYDKHLKNKIPFTSEEVDKYFSLLIRSKKQYGISIGVPRDLIKEGITVLAKKTLNEKSISCKIKWEKLNSSVSGSFESDTIIFNEDKIRGVMSYDIDMINTMYHEITHAVQELKINDDFMEEIITGKDMAIFMNSYGIAKDINYNLVSYEAEARLKGMINMVKYIEKTAPDVVDNYRHQARHIIDKEKSIMKKTDRLLYKEITDIHEAFDYCPNIYKRHVISMFPKLELEYNEDGTRKDLSEMLNELERQKQYYKDANTEEAKNTRKKYINTLEILLKNRKTKTIQSIKDYRAMQKMIKENKIKENPITFNDIKASFNRETVIIKSKISSILRPNEINNIKLRQNKDIQRIYNELKTK